MRTKISTLIILLVFICLSVGSGQAALRRDPISKKPEIKFYKVHPMRGIITPRLKSKITGNKEGGSNAGEYDFVETNTAKMKIGMCLSLELLLECADPEFSLPFVLRHRFPQAANLKIRKIIIGSWKEGVLRVGRPYLYLFCFKKRWRYRPGKYVIEVFKKNGSQTFARKNRMFIFIFNVSE